jgi:hypothetical protein
MGDWNRGDIHFVSHNCSNDDITHVWRRIFFFFIVHCKIRLLAFSVVVVVEECVVFPVVVVDAIVLPEKSSNYERR